MRPRRFLAVLGTAFASLAALLAPSTSRASDGGERGMFRWETPEGCPSSAAVEATILARLGTSTASRSRLEVRAVVTRDASGLLVRVSIGAAERSFVAPSCELAASAVAVIVATALEEAEPASSSSAAPAPAAPAAPEPSPPSPASGAPIAFELAASGSVDSASLPEAAPGITVSGELRAARWLTVGLSVAAFAPQTADAAPQPASRATIALVDLLLKACALAPIAREHDPGGGIEGGLCAGFGFGLLPASRPTGSDSRDGMGIRPEIWGGGRLRVPLSARIVVELEAAPLFDPSRPPFEIQGIGVLHRPPAVAFRAAAGVGLTFP